MNYYNEFDDFAAKWLESLIQAGVIPIGKVDRRSITEVTPNDLSGYTQCHFFAGIGGWSEALRLAEWSADRPVWTGSCPCQPFSTAGKQKGKADERHLWPVWFELIAKCKPATILGEQVNSSIAHGWLDSVYDDLESEGYAVGSAVLPACSVGQAHKRDRLWFVAKSDIEGESSPREYGEVAKQLCNGSLGNAKHNGLSSSTQSRGNAEVDDRPQEGTFGSEQFEGTSNTVIMADTTESGLERFARYDSREKGWEEQIRHYSETDTLEWVECPDGKFRPVKSGIRLLANGFPNRVGALRGFGNAIVPAVAAQFIKAIMN